MEASPRRVERGDWGRNGEEMEGVEDEEGENGWLSQLHLSRTLRLRRFQCLPPVPRRKMFFIIKYTLHVHNCPNPSPILHCWRGKRSNYLRSEF